MMSVIRKISILLFMLPSFIWSQDNNVLRVHPNHVEKVKVQFIDHPLLSNKLNSDSLSVVISVFTKNCKEGMITADSVLFTFKPTDSSSKTSITIIPDTLIVFSSHIFAFMLYEHAQIFEKPKKGNKPIFTTIETDEFDSLIFLDQRIDKKGQIWYLVQFNSDRYDSESVGKQIIGWTLRGRSRIDYWGFGCY